MNFLFFALITVGATGVLGQSPSGNPQISPPVSPPKLDPLEATMFLLEEGNDTIVLQDDQGDFILLIGNTGCGTTSLTKFISSHASDITSFWSGDRYLLQDTAGEISDSNLTLVSKTMFPTLHVEQKSNQQNQFYDLPGFGMTQGPPVEISSSLLSKMVIERAKRVKLIFVINHSSLKPGESRSDLKNLLDHTIELVKNPTKFAPGIAMFATKVQVPSTTGKSGDVTTEIVQGMADFLTNLKEKVPEIFGNEEKRNHVTTLLNALLSKKEDGSYARLGYFPQPSQIGPLTSVEPFLSKTKVTLDHIVHDNLEFVNISPAQDFGLALSPSSKYFLRRSNDRVEDRIVDLIQDIGVKVQSHFHSLITAGQTPAENILDQLYTELFFLKNVTKHLEGELESRSEFFRVLKQSLDGDLHIENIEIDLEKLGKMENYLNFLDLVSTQGHVDVGAPRKVSKKWTLTLKKYIDLASDDIYGVARQLNENRERAGDEMGKELKALYKLKVEQTKNPKGVKGEILNDIDSLTEMTSANVTTFNAFVNQSKETLGRLSVKGNGKWEEALKGLTHDVDLIDPHGDEKMPTPFKIYNWIRPFETLTRFLTVKLVELGQRVRDEEGEKLVKELRRNVTESAKRD